MFFFKLSCRERQKKPRKKMVFTIIKQQFSSTGDAFVTPCLTYLEHRLGSVFLEHLSLISLEKASISSTFSSLGSSLFRLRLCRTVYLHPSTKPSQYPPLCAPHAGEMTSFSKPQKPKGIDCMTQSVFQPQN